MLSLAVFAACAVQATGSCEIIPLLTPAKSASLAERQPTLTWAGNPVHRYRVQVAALLPEARVLVSHDIEVAGTSFRFPSPLPLERAGIKVLVSRDCPGLDAQDLNAEGAWFFVDMRPTCALDRSSFQQTSSGLQWAPVLAAQSYSIRVFDSAGRADAAGGALLPIREFSVSQPRLPAGLEKPGADHARVVTVQAICHGLASRPLAWPLQLAE